MKDLIFLLKKLYLVKIIKDKLPTISCSKIIILTIDIIIKHTSYSVRKEIYISNLFVKNNSFQIIAQCLWFY